MREQRISDDLAVMLNESTGEPALYVKCYAAKNGHQITDSDVDGSNYRKLDYQFFQLVGGGATDFNGNRAITRVSDLLGINPGGSDVASFLENLMYPAVKPIDAFSVNDPQREVGSSTAYVLSWGVTKETNPISSIIVDGNVIAPTGDTQSGTIAGNVASPNGSYSKSMSATAGNDTVTAQLSIGFYLKMFWDTLAGVPPNSAAIRALANSQLVGGGGSVIINTGTDNRQFAAYLPTGRALTSVIDLDALNLDITSLYVQSGVVVNDVAGTPHNYTQCLYTQAVPYAANHRHQLNFA